MGEERQGIDRDLTSAEAERDDWEGTRIPPGPIRSIATRWLICVPTYRPLAARTLSCLPPPPSPSPATTPLSPWPPASAVCPHSTRRRPQAPRRTSISLLSGAHTSLPRKPCSRPSAVAEKIAATLSTKLSTVQSAHRPARTPPALRHALWSSPPNAPINVSSSPAMTLIMIKPLATSSPPLSSVARAVPENR